MLRRRFNVGIMATDRGPEGRGIQLPPRRSGISIASFVCGTISSSNCSWLRKPGDRNSVLRPLGGSTPRSLLAREQRLPSHEEKGKESGRRQRKSLGVQGDPCRNELGKLRNGERVMGVVGKNAPRGFGPCLRRIAHREIKFDGIFYQRHRSKDSRDVRNKEPTPWWALSQAARPTRRSSIKSPRFDDSASCGNTMF